MQSSLKPENALRRAQDYIGSGLPHDALLVLQSTIRNRKFRQFAVEPLVQESVVGLFLKLCLQLKELKIAREGLHLYRSVTMLNNVSALGRVLLDFRDAAENILPEACTQFKNQLKAEEIEDDLEATQSPEALMMAALGLEVRSEAAKEVVG